MGYRWLDCLLHDLLIDRSHSGDWGIGCCFVVLPGPWESADACWAPLRGLWRRATAWLGGPRFRIYLGRFLHQWLSLWCGRVRWWPGDWINLFQRERHTVSRGVLCDGSAYCGSWSPISSSGNGCFPVALGGGAFTHFGICTVTAWPGCFTVGRGFHPQYEQVVAIQDYGGSVGGVGMQVSGCWQGGERQDALATCWKFARLHRITLILGCIIRHHLQGPPPSPFNTPTPHGRPSSHIPQATGGKAQVRQQGGH